MGFGAILVFNSDASRSPWRQN